MRFWADEMGTGTGWVNCEYRSYTFKNEAGDNASIVETEDSKKLRKGKKVPLTETEELQLKRTVSHGKGADGAYSFVSKV